MPALRARYVRRGEFFFGNGQLIRRDIEEADLIQPLDHIFAAIATRHAARAADTEIHISATLIQLFGDLGA